MHDVRCFAITTVDRFDRHERLERELARIGLPFEVLRAERPTEAAGFPSIGYRGVFESHLECLRRARALGVDIAIVAEDDIVVPRRFRRLFASVAAEAATLEWAILHLGHLPLSPACADAAVSVTRHIARCVGWEIYGAHLVAVRGDALDAVIADFERRLLPGGHRISVDGVYNEINRDAGRTALVCFPNLANQAPSPSGISPDDGIRQRMLRVPAAQRAIEATKRAWWDLCSLVPPPVHVHTWNARARVKSTRRNRRAVASGG